MTKILVLEYDTKLLHLLKNHQVVVKTNTLTEIEQRYSVSKQSNNVLAMCVNLPYTSVSQIDFIPEWGRIPLVISAYNIGDYELFFSKLNIIRSLNIRILLSNETENVFTELKILASLGIDCGLDMKEKKEMNDDSFLDLASYYYMSPVPHASIEPFEFILSHLTEEKYFNFDGVYFNDPILFKHISSLEDIEEIEIKDDDFNLKLNYYYKHFIDLDECSKCPAFKICNKQMMSRLHNCKNVMGEVYEYAELRNELNKNNDPKTICQL